ncbi:MAG: iron-sulfur cluster assembly accessory protein [Peptococcaceae bacterium]|jgi:iron-sulfur cluster assembly accessory protein|nr:iron-sulfur cluster assembly accessory protein [Peptococcaceae bacterium]
MLEVTEIAAQKVKEVMVSQNQENSYLRLYIAGFGCGGPNFGMALDESKTAEDDVYEAHGITVVVEKNLAPYLEGAVLNYVESEYGSGFQLKTPNQPDCSGGCSSCGS